MRNVVYHDEAIFLDDSFVNQDIISIKTSRKHGVRKNILRLIRVRIDSWIRFVPELKKLKNQKIDICVHLIIDKTKYTRQDVDNLLKVVFDGLQKDPNDKKLDYLLENDSQIIRCLVIKTPKRPKSETDIVLSVRKHNPLKQMTTQTNRGFIAILQNNTQ